MVDLSKVSFVDVVEAVSLDNKQIVAGDEVDDLGDVFWELVGELGVELVKVHFKDLSLAYCLHDVDKGSGDVGSHLEDRLRELPCVLKLDLVAVISELHDCSSNVRDVHVAQRIHSDVADAQILQ